LGYGRPMRSEKLVKDDTKVQRFDVKCSLR